MLKYIDSNKKIMNEIIQNSGAQNTSSNQGVNTDTAEQSQTAQDGHILDKVGAEHPEPIQEDKKSGGFFASIKQKWQAHIENNRKKTEARKQPAAISIQQSQKQSEQVQSVPQVQSTVITQEVSQPVPLKIENSDEKKDIDLSKPLTQEEAKRLREAEKIFKQGLSTIKDLIAPSSMEINFDHMKIGDLYTRSYFVYTYPRYIDVNWLSPVVNFDITMDISMFIYPSDSVAMLKMLRNKVAQISSSISIDREKGKVRDPAMETALEDAEELRTNLQRGQEKFFQFALYFTIYAEDQEKLKKVGTQLETILGGKLVLTKKADLQQEHAFNSSLPLCLDEVEIMQNMNTGPLSTVFPFTSSELTSNDGILYGLNRHNDSLIIFDRFSLENANSVIFAKSGAGKSYAVKLEMLRSMMFETDIIIIDPENEYQDLCNTVGGTYLNVSLNSNKRINPFDLPRPLKDEETKPGDLLRTSIINIHGLLKLMLGNVADSEEGLLDRALIDTYALKNITMQTEDIENHEPPTLNDFYDVLSSMKGAESLAQRLSKYTTGSFSGLFNKPTNVDLASGMVVFQVRDLEDELRPVAMYIILNYIWNVVRSSLKKRNLVIDEAWNLMQHEDSARFLFGLVKRARKYYLGVTTITQDTEDFIKSKYGKPIITNSSMQLLLRQSPASIDELAKIFNLTEGEKYLLMNSAVGQGLFFAGNKHVAIQVIASYTEHKIVTTNPEEVMKAKEEGAGEVLPDRSSQEE